MGNYLNSAEALTAFAEVYKSPYFVDKSEIISEIIPRIGTTEKYICITRPRRFGKSVIANMMGAFFSEGCDSEEIFRNLKISDSSFYKEHINKHPVITISFNRLPRRCSSYDQYISRIEQNLIEDLAEIYPHIRIDTEEAVWDALKRVHQTEPEARFIFILDEWDFIFHRHFVTDEDKIEYIDFLSNLLKDQPYVDLAYMTGILPIAKYST